MGRAIYVSSVNGDDANSGYAPEKAFRSLRKVNQMEIQPGDQILLERGFLPFALHKRENIFESIPHSPVS